MVILTEGKEKEKEAEKRKNVIFLHPFLTTYPPHVKRCNFSDCKLPDISSQSNPENKKIEKKNQNTAKLTQRITTLEYRLIGR